MNRKTIKLPPEFAKALKTAVADHRRNDPGITAVYFMPDRKGQELKLLEVTKSAFTVNRVWPFRYHPNRPKGYPFPLNLIVVSPDEWKGIKESRLSIPEPWGTSDDLKPVDLETGVAYEPI